MCRDDLDTHFGASGRRFSGAAESVGSWRPPCLWESLCRLSLLAIPFPECVHAVLEQFWASGLDRQLSLVATTAAAEQGAHLFSGLVGRGNICAGQHYP